MKKSIKALIAVIAVALPAMASATIVSDTSNPYVNLQQGQSYTVYHDLTSYGVPDANEVTNAWLRLSFSDGYHRGDWALDIANISAAGVSRTYEVDGTHAFGFDVRWIGVGAAGIDSLNDNGILAVTVNAANTAWWAGHNDFWWKHSTLYANVQAVPAPGALALLGLGLLGMGAVRRRRNA
ncbi:MAG: PEP-CTERM sorting domain-containing protein [Pseudomonadota bacterium]